MVSVAQRHMAEQHLQHSVLEYGAYRQKIFESITYIHPSAFTVLVLLSAIAASFSMRLGVLIDKSMIQNVFETDWAEFAR